MTPRGFFITGTDTGVGKTVFTSALARSLRDRGARVAAYKPACSGASPDSPSPVDQLTSSGALFNSRGDTGLGESGDNRTWPDVEALFQATGGQWPRDRICPQTFLAPLSPPAAAAREGRAVDESLLVEGYRWLAERADAVLVEGAGGFYSPISAGWLNADLAERIGLPVLIVAPNRLGTINQTLLTIEAVRRRGLAVAGVVLNRLEPASDSANSNAREITTRGGVRIWGEIPFTMTPELQPTGFPETMVQEIWTEWFPHDAAPCSPNATNE